ncbi:hypothetical protein [Terriglobus roseus]|uniref:GDSL-like Lipase/Acylhydrolase family protein n=1 Tax=Terriglobus roseus TaxID=392734 RepID=A0A1G7L5H9_9BACT|nr:hypothetical protein [Terriglobus roseus]SDF44715.1 hypothetical protein SAMN05444167_2439 [Terriglobus roseus]
MAKAAKKASAKKTTAKKASAKKAPAKKAAKKVTTAKHGRATRESSIQKAAILQADQILARRQVSRKTRAAALKIHVERVEAQMKSPGRARAGMPVAERAPIAAAAALQSAGYLLAVGDSWFDYPIHDVLTKLEDNYAYNVESSAHKGDPIEAMVSHVGQMDKFARLMDKIVALGVMPKAILVSGGGDDIAGDAFGMLINNIDLPIAGWNEEVVAGVIDTRIATAYRKMFTLLNVLCQSDLKRTLPILVHGYDYPVPDGRGFLGGWGPLPGPWLKPGFDEKLFMDLTQTTSMIAKLIDRFNTMLQKLVKEPGFENVRYVDLRGTLSNGSDYKKYWANELHPTGGGIGGGNDGFGAVAAKFQEALLKYS